eukprot:scaffold55684_cov43-Attheya_sp.AAC.3
MINNKLGLNASHIAGDKNIIVDAISRVHTTNTPNPEFPMLLKEFPQLQCCQRYHPSAKLVSTIYEAMLSGHAADPTKKQPKKRFEATKANS